MKLRKMKQVLCLVFALYGTLAIAQGPSCIEGTILAPGGATIITNCLGDGLSNEVRFKTTPSAMPYAFLITDENNIILEVSLSNFIDLENLPEGSFRVWAFSFLGQVLAEPGQDAATAELASLCYQLTSNFIEIVNIVPDGEMVSTTNGETSVITCPGDGNADVIDFMTTSDGPNYAYLITDEVNKILDITIDPSFDFDGAPEGTCRIWGVAYVGNLIAEVSQNAATADLSDECFDLSDNFIEVIRTVPDGGTVSLTNGETSEISCEGDAGDNIFSFSNVTDSPAPYTFILTDEDNNIIAVLDDNTYDFNGIAPGTYRVWGVSYTGTFTGEVGDDAASVDLSDDCYDLSDNFVEITRRDVDGATVSLADGSDAAVACVGDGNPNILTIINTSDSQEEYLYIITDDNNEILNFSEDGIIDFDGAGTGVCRVWGLAYSGNLLAEIGDDIMAISLSDECYDLSDNFVEVTRIEANGGVLNIEDGSTGTVACVDDGNPDLVTVEVNDEVGVNYIFVITDSDNIILGFSEEPTIDFEGAGTGVCRIWGVAYSGNLIAEVGDDAANTDITDDCYDLSDNFIEIIRTFVDGATVSLEDGSTMASVCTGDGIDDVLTFVHTSDAQQSYVYVVTDTNNVILNFSEDGNVNFEGAGGGICRVWGLSYSGTQIAEVGDTATNVVFSIQCFDLSDNFVEIDRTEVLGGFVSLSGGVTEVPICTGDDLTDSLTVQVTGEAGDYIFVVTDENNMILDFSETGIVDFEDAGAGVCRVWGVAYSGNILAEVGDDLTAVPFSDECFVLSGNFVTFNRFFVDGGTVATDAGDTDVFVCGNDGEPDVFSFTGETTSTEDYIFIITNNLNEVLTILMGNSIDFDGAVPGDCRVWGLSYTGEVLAEVGDNIFGTTLTDDCYELSANFVQVRREAVEGGEVAMPSGETELYTCPGDGNEDVVSFTTTGASTEEYIYLVTDADNLILAIVTGNSFDFDGAGEGVCRVWGLAYSGTLTAEIGDDAAAVVLSDECADLSDNFITVIRESPIGGTVSLPNGETSIFTCPGDDLADIVTFDSTGTSGGAYIYLVTDENNNILSFPSGDSQDFNGAPAGVCRIYGVAYTGTIVAELGDNVVTQPISDDCADLSDNYIEVIRDQPEGGIVSLDDGNTSELTCPGDGEPDLLSFDSLSTFGLYAYVVTDTNNVILALVDGDTFDFEGAGQGVCRVWGLAFTGNVIAEVGDTATAVDLSDDCWDLSDNFIEVVRITPEAGTISSNDGATELELCVGDGNPDIVEFNLSGDIVGEVLYVVTDPDGFIVGSLEDPSFNFDNAIGGAFYVYALAYTGNPITIPGDNIFEVDLSTDCWDLTDNFLDLTLTRINGGSLFTGTGEDDTVYICAGDGVDDIISFFSSSGANEAEYQYFITDTENNIISFMGDNTQNFENTGFNVLRVWGVSYSGTFLANFGDDADEIEFSDECWDLSDNFITIVRDIPEGGMITTSDGDTELLLCIGGVSGIVEFVTSSTSSSGYVYILTDTSDVILDYSETDDFDFNPLGADTLYHIWGLSYTGELMIEPGDTVTNATLSSSCFELSENSIEIYRARELDGGEISTLAGDTTIYTCPGDDNADLIVLFTSSLDTGYQYVITNENDMIIVPDVAGNVIDFNNASPGTYRIYGISYFGQLDIDFNENVNSGALSDSCYAASSNFITVVHQIPEAGEVSTSDGLNDITVVIDDGEADEITFVNDNASDAPYVYVITDESDKVLGVLAGDTFDFEGSNPGNCKVYGVAHTGELTINIGDIITTATLSDDCFDLSDNFVLIKRVSLFDDENEEEEIADPDDSFSQWASAPSVSVAPNPAQDMMMVTYTIQEPKNETSALQVFSTTGQNVFNLKVSTIKGQNQYELNVNDLIPGLYILTIQNGQSVERIRFMKQ